MKIRLLQYTLHPDYGTAKEWNDLIEDDFVETYCNWNEYLYNCAYDDASYIKVMNGSDLIGTIDIPAPIYNDGAEIKGCEVLMHEIYDALKAYENGVDETFSFYVDHETPLELEMRIQSMLNGECENMLDMQHLFDEV